jgi:hypothetical protein
VETDHVTLTKETLDVLLLATELASELLNDACLLDISFSLSFNRTGNVLVLAFHLDATAEAGLNLETLLL